MRSRQAGFYLRLLRGCKKIVWGRVLCRSKEKGSQCRTGSLIMHIMRRDDQWWFLWFSPADELHCHVLDAKRIQSHSLYTSIILEGLTKGDLCRRHLPEIATLTTADNPQLKKLEQIKRYWEKRRIHWLLLPAISAPDDCQLKDVKTVGTNSRVSFPTGVRPEKCQKYE